MLIICIQTLAKPKLSQPCQQFLFIIFHQKINKKTSNISQLCVCCLLKIIFSGSITSQGPKVPRASTPTMPLANIRSASPRLEPAKWWDTVVSGHDGLSPATLEEQQPPPQPQPQPQLQSQPQLAPYQTNLKNKKHASAARRRISRALWSSVRFTSRWRGTGYRSRIVLTVMEAT